MMKKIMACLLFCAVFLTACSSSDSKESKKLSEDNSSKITTQDANKTNKKNNVESKEIKNSTQNTVDNSENKTTTSNNSDKEQDISKKVKEYITSGQDSKPEAQKLKWSKTFLDEVDIEKLNKEYISNGGNNEDVEKFAEYITKNAPILSNWEDLFKKDLLNQYGEEVVKVEKIEDELYQAYINKDGKEIPYVVVSSRTGYYHG